jgi:hypothetical protein
MSDINDLMRDAAVKQVDRIKECRAELRALSVLLHKLAQGEGLPTDFDAHYASLMAFRGHGLLGELQGDYEHIISTIDDDEGADV